MANERALGLSFIYAAQTWKQMVVSYGEDEARSLFGLTNNLVIFGGGKDIHFYKELSDLIDDVRISRQTVSDGPGGIGTSRAGEDVRVLRPGDIRRIPERHALVIAGNAPPIIAKLRRCIDGTDGRAAQGRTRRRPRAGQRRAGRRQPRPRHGAPRPRSPTPAQHRLAPSDPDDRASGARRRRPNAKGVDVVTEHDQPRSTTSSPVPAAAGIGAAGRWTSCRSCAAATPTRWPRPAT